MVHSYFGILVMIMKVNPIEDRTRLKNIQLYIYVCMCIMYWRTIWYRVPVDPLEWQISQDTANSIVACLANTVGAAESVLRVAATGHDKRLFLKVLI